MDRREGEIAGKYSALLTGAEVGLGSLLHGWRVPFSGHFLSLNQGFLLSKATQRTGGRRSSLGLRVSLVGATLKSLSPAGKRLTPMLAISVQGALFSAGHWLAGGRTAGIFLGMVLLGLWGFLQPLLIYFLIFGQSILSVGEYFLSRLQEVVPIEAHHLWTGLGLVVGLKVLLSLAVAWLSLSPRSEGYEARVHGWMERVPLPSPRPETTVGDRVRRVLGDLLRPWFLFSLLLMGVFAFVSRPDQVNLVWFALRPVAVGFVVFYALRYLPLDRWLMRVCRPDSPAGLALARALATLRGARERAREGG